MIQIQQNQIMRFARALFDNVAEMPRELSFKKGDILTVLQDKYENNSEWWVCSLRSLVGLAPANRLEAMPILIEATPTFKKQISASLYDELPDQPMLDNTYSNIPTFISKPNNIKDDYSVYQMPNEEVYVNPQDDGPKSLDIVDDQLMYQTPSNNRRKSSSTYLNITDSLGVSSYSQIAPYLSNSLIQNTKTNEYYNNRFDYSDSFSDATSTSFTDTVASSQSSFNQLSISSSESGDLKLMPPSTNSPLQISQEQAIATFRQYQTETTACCQKVIDFAKSKWKSEEMLKPTIKSIKSSFLDLFQNLQTVNNFSNSILENSKNCGDINLTKKIWKHLQHIQEATLTTKESIDKLESVNWNPEKIAIIVRLAIREGADCLSQVVSAARNVLIHIRSLGVTIIGNANVLFPEVPFDMTLKMEDNNASISVQKSEKSIPDKTETLEIMRLFGHQMKSQTEHVNETVNDFIKLLSNQNQLHPPKDTVISHSKFVVRSATQLVCIAKNLTDAQIKNIPNQKIEQEGNNLCNSLKIMVNTTKEILLDSNGSIESFQHLITLLKSVKTNVNNLQTIVVESVNQ